MTGYQSKKAAALDEEGFYTIHPKDEDDDIQVYQRPWVGLTRDEQSFVYSSLHSATSRKDSFWVDFANAIEDRLKEKNT